MLNRYIEARFRLLRLFCDRTSDNHCKFMSKRPSTPPKMSVIHMSSRKSQKVSFSVSFKPVLLVDSAADLESHHVLIDSRVRAVPLKISFPSRSSWSSLAAAFTCVSFWMTCSKMRARFAVSRARPRSQIESSKVKSLNRVMMHWASCVSIDMEKPTKETWGKLRNRSNHFLVAWRHTKSESNCWKLGLSEMVEAFERASSCTLISVLYRCKSRKSTRT